MIKDQIARVAKATVTEAMAGDRATTPNFTSFEAKGNALNE